MSAAPTELTLGPNLFNWAPEKWRDFYFRIADEAPVAVVYLGETICSKRAPLFDDYYEAVVRTAWRGRQDRGAFDARRDGFEDRSPAGQRRLRQERPIWSRPTMLRRHSICAGGRTPSAR